MILCGETTEVTGDSTGLCEVILPPGGKRVEGGEMRNGLRRVAYTKISDGSEVRRGHCPRI